ncbi:hypothetical protein NDU88_000556 [Pleurodeles waltl]|uniref:Uncharacterized protein n=1 Tax=Pleurodeles waltl TaxID=8319 RepID=A0AAV7WFU9_PLEWA|nr:hypothetical protein NDU88_000556 [Pleurodeles waltl]
MLHIGVANSLAELTQEEEGGRPDIITHRVREIPPELREEGSRQRKKVKEADQYKQAPWNSTYSFTPWSSCSPPWKVLILDQFPFTGTEEK